MGDVVTSYKANIGDVIKVNWSRNAITSHGRQEVNHSNMPQQSTLKHPKYEMQYKDLCVQHVTLPPLQIVGSCELLI